MNALAHEEHEAWRRVVAELLATGAVTLHDCEERRGAPPTTPGARVFAALRDWERAVIDLYVGEGMRRR